MNYTLGFDAEAEEDLRGLSPHTRREVNKVLRRLRRGPDLRVDKLLEDADDLWSTRAGRGWRVIFYVGPGRHVQIKRIRRRADAYEGIEHPEQREIGEAAAVYSEIKPGVDALVPAAAAD